MIVDEVHAVAGTKRGAHLALTLERLDALLERPAQRIGLSATVRPARGGRPLPRRPGAGRDRGAAQREGLGPRGRRPGRGHDRARGVRRGQRRDPRPQPVDLAARRGARRRPDRPAPLDDRLRQLPSAGRAAHRAAQRDRRRPPARSDDDRPPAQIMAQSGCLARRADTIIAKAHHGSVSKEQRALIEDDLKRGRLPAVVATSSLELGIDMGAVDLVVQIESPPSVASALQRVGRAGHQVGEVSRGVLFPKHRGDLAQTAVAVRADARGRDRERSGSRPTRSTYSPSRSWPPPPSTRGTSTSSSPSSAAARRSPPLPRSAYDATLDLLAGRYPSDEFAELRPRIVWDRVTGTLTGRPGAQRLAVTSGGTIPDRGLFGVYLVGEGTGRRVGELDEEMVYESRVGDVFALGATSWRIEDITHDRVLVTPAPGVPGRLPFWKGDTLGRPAELGEAIGAFTRELAALPTPKAERARTRPRARRVRREQPRRLHRRAGRGHPHRCRATCRCSSSGSATSSATGGWSSTPRTAPRCTRPWALAINARLRERYGIDGQAVASDDGIVVRIPDTDAEPPTGEVVAFEPDEIEEIVTTEVGGSALFASRFRECAARALLLPRRDPGRRSPLWQQRQRSAQLLEVASRYPSFPIVLEAVRECLQDVYDLPGLVDLMQRVDRREVSVVDVATTQPSPYARTPAVRLRRPVRLRGRLPARRAPGGRAQPRPGPARRAARPRRAARAARPRGAGRGRGRAAAARSRPPGPRRRGRRRPAAAARPAHDRRGRRPGRRRSRRRRLAGCARRRPPGRRGPDRRRGALGRHRGRRPAARRSRRARPARHPGRLRRPGRRPAGRPGRPVTPAPTARSPPTRSPAGSAWARPSSGRPCSGSRRRAGCSTASSARPARAPSGATPRCCAGSGAARWPGCARRSSRSSRRRSPGSSPPGSTSARRLAAAVARVARRRRLLTVVDQLAGCPVPASALEPLVLAEPGRATTSRRCSTSSPAPARCCGPDTARCPGRTAGSRSTSPTRPRSPCPSRRRSSTPSSHQAVLDALDARRGVVLPPARRPGRRPSSTTPLAGVLWDLVWAGRIGNDTLAPLRVARSAAASGTAPAAPPPRVRACLRSGPPHTAGRWALLPALDTDPTRRAHAAAERLLDRHGVVTRGAVQSERTPGGFAAVYKVLSAFEDSGRCRRGYFVDGLGAAQFGTAGAVDRLRTFTDVASDDKPIGDRARRHRPRQPLRRRAALAGRRSRTGDGTGPAARPGRWSCWSTASSPCTSSAAARTLLTWSDDREILLAPAAEALADRRAPRPARPADGREGRRRRSCSAPERRRCARR